MQRDHPQASLRLQCRLLGVCRSGLYYQPRQLDPEQLALMRRIDELRWSDVFRPLVGEFKVYSAWPGLYG